MWDPKEYGHNNQIHRRHIKLFVLRQDPVNDCKLIKVGYSVRQSSDARAAIQDTETHNRTAIVMCRHVSIFELIYIVVVKLSKYPIIRNDCHKKRKGN